MIKNKDRMQCCLRDFSWLLLRFSPPVMMSNHSNERVVYKREQLIKISRIPRLRPQIPQELRRRRHGCRAGGKVERERKRRFKPALPSFIMGDMTFLANTMDELDTLMRTNLEFRQDSLMCFTETWLQEHIPISSDSLSGFQTIRADRDMKKNCSACQQQML